MAGPSQNISEQVKRQMNQPQIHDAWERNYRSPENEQFFEQAYDDFVRRIGQPPGSHALDIGCGICANSMRLARRGYIVSAADYSEPILVQARENVSRHRFVTPDHDRSRRYPKLVLPRRSLRLWCFAGACSCTFRMPSVQLAS